MQKFILLILFLTFITPTHASTNQKEQLNFIDKNSLTVSQEKLFPNSQLRDPVSDYLLVVNRTSNHQIWGYLENHLAKLDAGFSLNFNCAAFDETLNYPEFYLQHILLGNKTAEKIFIRALRSDCSNHFGNIYSALKKSPFSDYNHYLAHLDSLISRLPNPKPSQKETINNLHFSVNCSRTNAFTNRNDPNYLQCNQ